MNATPLSDQAGAVLREPRLDWATDVHPAARGGGRP